MWRFSKISKDGQRETLISSNYIPGGSSCAQFSSQPQASPRVFSQLQLLLRLTQLHFIPRSGAEQFDYPVAGVRPDQLHDTFSESRSEGRVHDAIDIAARWAHPYRCSRGNNREALHSERGGTTIYQLSADNKFDYYAQSIDMPKHCPKGTSRNKAKQRVRRRHRKCRSRKLSSAFLDRRDL